MHGNAGCVFAVWHLNHVLFKSSLIVMFAELRMSEHASHMRLAGKRVCALACVCRAECGDIRFISMYIMCSPCCVHANVCYEWQNTPKHLYLRACDL